MRKKPQSSAMGKSEIVYIEPSRSRVPSSSWPSPSFPRALNPAPVHAPTPCPRSLSLEPAVSHARSRLGRHLPLSLLLEPAVSHARSRLGSHLPRAPTGRDCMWPDPHRSRPAYLPPPTHAAGAVAHRPLRHRRPAAPNRRAPTLPCHLLCFKVDSRKVQGLQRKMHGF
ncbi:uncharacterized protein [Miscanthus floridulus]|uniref:uncharacterized protein isoform X2 n=1 Tax=Miscanthus floridulus TaxID=154761 RepID=UPI00345AD1A9